MGYIPYRPDAEGAHPFDRLVASRDKRKVFIADAKTKPRRKYYPDTGINTKAYKEYKFIQDKYGIAVFLFFVDYDLGKVYGGFLARLSNPTDIYHKGKQIEYPLTQGNIIYFPLKNMADISVIEDTTELQNLSTRNERYANVQ